MGRSIWKRQSEKSRRAYERKQDALQNPEFKIQITYQSVVWTVIRSSNGSIWGYPGTYGRTRRNLPQKIMERAQAEFDKMDVEKVMTS